MNSFFNTLKPALKKLPFFSTASNFYWYLQKSYLMPHHLLYRLLYVSLYSDSVWMNILNRKGRKNYLKHPASLNSAQERLARNLREEGNCVFEFSDLFPSRNFQEYADSAEAYLAEPQIQAEIREAEKAIRKGGQGIDSKYYLIKLWKQAPLGLGNLFLNLAASDEILGIVNSYMQMHSRAHYLDFWYNCPMAGTNSYSQKWHRDSDDKKQVKLFFYLRNVDEENGALQYIPKSHPGGSYELTFPRKLPYNSYPEESLVNRQFSGKIVTAYGKAGAMILADTTGLHRGGHAKTKPRFLFHAMYLSDGKTPTVMPRNWSLLSNTKPLNRRLSAAQRHALYIGEEG